MRPTIPRNSLQAVEARRLGVYSRRMKSMYRYHTRLIKNMLTSPNWTFLPVLSHRAYGTPAFFCPDKLFVDHKRTCFSIRGHKCEPSRVYSLPQRSHSQKGRCDCFVNITRAGMANPSPPPCDLLLVLTGVGLLEVRNLHTGTLLKTLDLRIRNDLLEEFDSFSSLRLKLYYDSMEHDQNYDQVVITSSGGCGKSNVVFHIVILEICPEVKILMRVLISRKVFGRSLTKVYLNDGIFYAMHRGKKEIHLYDFVQMKAMNHIRMDNSEPILEIKVLPEPVFVAPNADEVFEVGGFPFHYVTRLPGTDTTSLRTLDHQELARFEQTDEMCMDSVKFHSEDNGIIVHARHDMLRYYKLESSDTEAFGSSSSLASSKAPFILRRVRDFRLCKSQKLRSVVSRHKSFENDPDLRERRQKLNENSRLDQQQTRTHEEDCSESSADGYCLRRSLGTFGPRHETILGEEVRVHEEGPAENSQRGSRSLSPPTSSPSNTVPEGSYALRRSQRIHHLSSISEVPLYYLPNAEEDRVLFSDDYENELGVTLLFGRDPDDVCKRGCVQMFDDVSGQLLRTMHFNNTLDVDVSYSITLDLDVLMVVAQPDKSSASHTTVYRLTNKDSLTEEDRKRALEHGGPQRHPIMLPRTSQEFNTTAGRSRRR